MRRLLLLLGITLGGAALVNAQPNDNDLPSAVDLRPKFASFGLGPKAQGSRDTCSLFAITGLVEYEIANASDGKGPGRLSEEYLIWAANQAAGGDTDQAMFYEAVHGLEAFGICTQKLLPYRTRGTEPRQPSAAASRDASLRTSWEQHWIKRWDSNSGLSAEQVRELKQQLADAHPVAVGLRWPRQSAQSDQIIAVPPPDQVFDGHSVLFVGYRDDPQAPGGGFFTFRNHSGTSWGQNGYGTMSYAYAATYANDALALHFLPESSTKSQWFEAEALQHDGSCPSNVQDMSPFGGKMWSDGKQLFGACVKGGSLELSIPVSNEGRYTVSVIMTCAPDFGDCSFAIDGKPLGGEFDGYSGRVHASGRLRLGEVDLSSGMHRLTITSIGKNPLSQGYKLGIDAIGLSAAE